MISSMVIIDKMLLYIIVSEAKEFLIAHTDENYESITTIQDNLNKLVLHDYTATLSVYGKLDFMIIMSFEESIIKNIANMFLKGEEISDNEKEEIYDSSLKEAVNMITGSSLPFFINNGEGTDIKTPSMIDETKIKEYNDMIVFSENLITKFGKLSISIIN